MAALAPRWRSSGEAMSDLHAAFENLTTDLREAGNPEKAPDMERYMKDQFEFLGITSPERKALEKPLLRAAKEATAEDILDVADRCWAEDAREFQYTGSVLLRAQAKKLTPPDLDKLHYFIVTKSWWDTIDALASHPLGTLVTNFPELTDVMDVWIDDENMWVARSAILHQLRYKHDVNQDRLFSYVLKRCDDTEFFIRKSLGWALRSYAREEPDAVRGFVAEHGDQLSGLTRREAMKHLG